MAETTTTVEQSILEAVARLLARQPLGDLSVAQILVEAQVSRTTFYAYFSSRDDAFVEVASALLDEIAELLEQTLSDSELRSGPGLGAAARGWVRDIEPRRGVLRSAMDEWSRIPQLQSLYLAHIHRLEATLAAGVEADRASGRAPEGVPAPALAAVVIWTVERTVGAALGGAPGLQRSGKTIDALIAAFRTTVFGPTASAPEGEAETF